MPSAAARVCRCGRGVAQAGHVACPSCEATYGAVRRPREQGRQSSSARGYGHYWATVFCPRFRQMLIAAGIPPVCGAALPGGPSMTDSRCKAEGRLVGDEHGRTRLHTDHDPPLRPEERRDRRKVCDPMRVGLLCGPCHSVKTQKEQASRAV